MEPNDKAEVPETSLGQPVDDTEISIDRSVSPAANLTEPPVAEVASDATVDFSADGESAVHEKAAHHEKAARIPTDETPFDRRPVKTDKIDWGGIGIAFFGGIGGNFFLALFIFFLQRMLGAIVYGPGVLAILTGLFVVMQLLAPLSVEIRRMTISFWFGLLFGYVLIAVIMAPYFAMEQG